MRLTEFFVIEGADDAPNRQMAAYAAESLIEYFSKPRKPEYVFTDDEGNASTYFYGKNMKEIPEDLRSLFDNIGFFIAAVPPDSNRRGASYSNDGQTMPPGTMICYFKPKGEQVTEKAWGMYVTKFANKILAQSRSALVHEFVHALDFERVKDPNYVSGGANYDVSKLFKGDKEELKKYVNHPLEMNALFQQYVDRIERAIDDSGIDSFDGVKKFLFANNAQEFVKGMFDNFPPQVVSSLTPDSRRRFIKRFTQLWHDLKRKYAG